MAPAANIVLGRSGPPRSSNSLYQAADTAVTKLGASVVSMSFGSSLEYLAMYGGFEQQLDSMYFAPALAFNPNVTFLASTGDSGSAYPGHRRYPGPSYPAVSPLVVGVGGTTLNINGTSGNYTLGK